MRTKGLLFLALLFLIPSVVFADGRAHVPNLFHSHILNLFHWGTLLPATLVGILIILLESALLRITITEVRYFSTLWRSAVLKIASGITGSVLLVFLCWDSFFVWDAMTLIFPLLFISVITEIPALRLLYKQIPLSWGRACALGIVINFCIFAVVMAIEFSLAVGYIGYGRIIDKKERSEWVHPELLAKSTGLIYSTETSLEGKVGLRVLDVRTARWQSFSNSPTFNPSKWDVEGRTFAFVRSPSLNSEEEPAVIASLPDFSIIREISLLSLRDPQYNNGSNWQGIEYLSLSPDAKKLAVLFLVADAVAYRDRSSYYYLGKKCVFAVFDVNSGQQIIRATRWASAGELCWFPDSKAVLFTSFKDESLYKASKADMSGRVGFDFRNVWGSRFKAGIFSFNITSGEIRPFADGEQYSVSVGSEQFLIGEGDYLRVVDTQGTTKASLEISRFSDSTLIIAPNGKLILAGIRYHNPFYGVGRLAVIDLAQPDLRHIIEEELVFRYKWTTAGDETSIKTMHPLP